MGAWLGFRPFRLAAGRGRRGGPGPSFPGTRVCTRESIVYIQQKLLCMNKKISRVCTRDSLLLVCWIAGDSAKVRVAKNQDDGVATKEEFANESVLVHWLGL